MHPSKVSETEKSQLVNETRWQYYGTAGTRGNLSLTWNASALPTSSVTIELWGYQETGEALCRLPLQGLLGQKHELAEMRERESQAGEILEGIGVRKVETRKGNWQGCGWMLGF